jgi:GNAT superfamily N-acetyltransferase
MVNTRAKRLVGTAHRVLAQPTVGESIYTTSTIDHSRGAEMLSALPNEACSHSWRAHLPKTRAINADDVECLVDRENAHRPTTFYWFWISRGETDELFAVATVADRIARDTPVDGFPVLARSYIRPEYRSRGLYEYLVSHRVEQCRLRFGAALRGIHFGTNEPRILRAARRHMNPSPIMLGQELLTCPERTHHVSDYLALASGYLAQLRVELAAIYSRGSAEAHDVWRLGNRLLGDCFEPCAIEAATDYGRLRTAIMTLDRSVDAPGWHELLAFCDAIPLRR